MLKEKVLYIFPRRFNYSHDEKGLEKIRELIDEYNITSHYFVRDYRDLHDLKGPILVYFEDEWDVRLDDYNFFETMAALNGIGFKEIEETEKVSRCWRIIDDLIEEL
jgi:hypothetical protein